MYSIVISLEMKENSEDIKSLTYPMPNVIF